MDLNAFIEERRPRWKRLERLVERIESGGMGMLAQRAPKPDEPREDPGVLAARELAALYRAACADLIRARTETANAELIGYLNGLVGRAYGAIYRGQRRFSLWPIVRFLLIGFPRLVRARRAFVGAAAAFFFAGFGLAFIAETADSTAKHYLLPAQIAALEESIDSSNAVKGGIPMGASSNMAASAQIGTNNIGVSFAAFALGGTGGVGTAGTLFYNGVLMGDLAAIYARHDLSLPFWALILPHSVIEIMAILIAGAAGLLIGRALVAPGDVGRRAALARDGKEAVELVLGCAALLVIAAVIEGFVTPQMGIPPAVKVAIGAGTGVFLFLYLVVNERILEGVGMLEPLLPREEQIEPDADAERAA